MSNKSSNARQTIFATSNARQEQLCQWFGTGFAGGRQDACLISISGNSEPNDFRELPTAAARALIVFEDFPVEMALVDVWRTWAMDRGAWEVHIAFLRFYEGSDEDRYREILGACKEWGQPVPKQETCAITKGAFVRMSDDPAHRNLATLLTMTLGSMGDLLTRAEVLARRFKGGCPDKNGQPDRSAIRGYLSEIDALLKEGGRELDAKPGLDVEPAPDHLPKLLLRGDSGVGKSLIAEYLHRKIGWQDRPLRIPIPEYLSKEDMFEYDLFGYSKGAYTGGKDEGSRGLLLASTGRVVFLDEIGEANEYLQAKLLAFLDDYRVRPRGWEGEPFYCPVLVVAATNKDLEAMARAKKFRGDLLARFTDRHAIPGLNDRIADLPFILDCLLQRPAMNPGSEIEEIGKGAFKAFKERDYSEGNFRELESLFRTACENARRDGRKYLVAKDVN